jgi:hypothetical protein
MEDVYAIFASNVPGLVRINHGSITCLTCGSKCAHPSKVESVLKKYEGLDCPEVIDAINLRLTKRNISAYHLQCASTKCIPFDLPQTLVRNIQRQPEDIFILDDGTLKTRSLETQNCSLCSAPLHEKEIKEEVVSMFLSKYKMIEVQCKK